METKKKLQLTKEWSGEFKGYRLYLWYDSEIIKSYDPIEIKQAKKDFENYNPKTTPIIIAEREV